MKNFFSTLFAFWSLILLGQTNSQNYILKKTYQQPFSGMVLEEYDENGIIINSSNNTTATSFLTDITYFDGLGRKFIAIKKGQSASGMDIIQYMNYDYAGRIDKEFLPYVRSDSSLNSETHPENFSYQFYNSNNYNLTGDFNFTTTDYPYSSQLYDKSSLNRILKKSAPGEDWKLDSNHEIKADLKANGTNEVKLYKAISNLNILNNSYDETISNINGTTYYYPGQLYKEIVKVENWMPIDGVNNTTETFTDKDGKIILKRSYNNLIAHDTYYIYDSFKKLAFILPPLVNFTSIISQTVLDGLCYQYKYDSKNRLVEKKLPGKQWEYIVYDKLDRVVATGPALSPFKDITGEGWIISKYDAFNRVVYTGWMPTVFTTTNRSVLQTQFNNASSSMNETKTATSTNTTLNGINFRYSNVAIPTTGYHILTVNYYDDYNFPNAPTSIPTSIEGEPVYYNATTKPKGLPTGWLIRVLESSLSSSAETSYALYDVKARPIRNYSLNHLGGFTQIDYKLDFIGKILYTIIQHRRLAVTNVLTIKDEFTYSLQNRLVSHTSQIDGGLIELLAKNEYNELGQLISKRVGGTDLSGAASLQKVDYNYNIRGWLIGINDVNSLSQPSIPLDLFAFKINYNSVDNDNGYTGIPLYNGNISETYWRTSSDNVLRKYGYNYDNLNRLIDAIYIKPNNAVPVTNSFNESLFYDKNGNITSLNRMGEYDDEVYNISIDELTYTYNSNAPNRLMSVADGTASSSGFADNNTNGNDYDYDANGNMIFDKNKNITAITYNHLNLPTKIAFGNGSYIENIYNSIGQKVKKMVKEGAVIITTDYLSGFQYKNDVLQFFPIAEGYVNVTIGKYGSSIYNYIYNYTDHLGNIRLSYGKDNTSGLLKIFEENHYYPFGLKHRDYNAVQLIWSRESNEELARIKPSTPVVPPSYKYKFSGKEFQDELGLNMYDFEARGYMPDIGRTTTIDPHAYNYPWASPYNYAFNNPTLVIDPDGKDGIFTGAGTKDDPYRVKANYYYYGLNAKQAKGLNEAISSYNNNGKARSFMDTNGNKTYVVMELMATEVADVDTAREKAFGDSVEIGEESARYGNIVTTGGESSNVHFGEASDLRVTLNQDKITSILADFPGGNEDRFIKGTFIHEIGHNLGASHGDPGSIMRDQSRDPQLNKSQFGGGGSGVYIYGYPSINTDSVRAFMGRVNSPGSINSYYLNTKENDNVKNHKDNGAPGAIRKGN